MEPSAPLDSDMGTEHHHPIFRMIRGHGDHILCVCERYLMVEIHTHPGLHFSIYLTVQVQNQDDSKETYFNT